MPIDWSIVPNAGSYPLPLHHLTCPTIIVGATLDRANVTALVADLDHALRAYQEGHAALLAQSLR